MIQQLNPYIPVITPLGEGYAVMVIDYGIDYNTCWVVALEKDGQIKHFDANDVKMCTNYTYGINVEKPPFPREDTTTRK
jgi:hypothetical protein